MGSSASIPFTLRVEGAPQVINPLQWQYAEIGQFFSFNIPQDTFIDPNFDPLVFHVSYANQTNLPPDHWLTFNPISVTLAGTPSSQDKGVSNLRLIAQDPRGGSAYIDFNLTVNPRSAPQFKEAIPSRNVDVGEELDVPLPPNTFEGDDLRYTAVLNR